MSFSQDPGPNDGLPTGSQIVGNQKDALQKDSHSKTLKLGDKIKATVYQIRKKGLVLDLGSGLKGMYIFEVQYCRVLHHCTMFIRNKLNYFLREFL